jgi:hypothetical protein
MFLYVIMQSVFSVPTRPSASIRSQCIPAPRRYAQRPPPERRWVGVATESRQFAAKAA